MVILILIIILILILFYRPSRYDHKGLQGEARVERTLMKIQNEECKVFNDILLKTENGSTQIDHIVISTHGIFVIETKNYSGWIYGNENSEYWTQIIYKSKTKFRNPIKQNWAHIYALKGILSDFKHITYHPIVVFAGTGILKSINTKTPVIYSEQLMDTITDTSGISSLSMEQIHIIANRLDGAIIQGRKAEKAHENHVRAQIYEREQKEKSLICPRCGGNLVVRNGQYGPFYGCSNYPKCKYTLNY